MMASEADGGLELYAGVSMVDDRLGAEIPVTAMHAFYEVFDTMTPAERDVVCRALVGFLAGFPQRRNRAASFQDPVGTTITAGRDLPARSRHVHL